MKMSYLHGLKRSSNTVQAVQLRAPGTHGLAITGSAVHLLPPLTTDQSFDHTGFLRRSGTILASLFIHMLVQLDIAPTTCFMHAIAFCALGLIQQDSCDKKVLNQKFQF